MIGDDGDANGLASGDYASPPCFLHELDPSWRGIETADAEQTRRDVMRWRRAERERLHSLRRQPGTVDRHEADRRIVALLLQIMGPLRGLTVGLYFPIHGEPDMRQLASVIIGEGGVCALPVVIERNRPLIYRCWTPGEKLVPGVWRIPCPGEDRPEARPDIMLAPVLGFDARCFRLGNGGGYFDRTLAGQSPRPKVIGVGYERLRIASIYPQPHDIPMDAIVTEQGVSRPDGDH